MQNKWINFKEEKPPINIDILIWVGDDFQFYDVGSWNGNEQTHCNGWSTNADLAKYREITHWMLLPEKPII